MIPLRSLRLLLFKTSFIPFDRECPPAWFTTAGGRLARVLSFANQFQCFDQQSEDQRRHRGEHAAPSFTASCDSSER
jgi:hypothetical protein